MSDKVRVVKTDAEIEELVQDLVSGRIKIVDVRVGGCKCGGKLKSSPRPNWMNRFTCEACGKHVSR